MGASLSRREASSDEPDATAPLRGDDDEALRGDVSASAPEASAALKRPRSGSKAEVCFTRVIEKDLNITAILAYAGYRTVLRLEELCPRARRIVRGARIELDISKETNIAVAARTAARAEIFEARRSGTYESTAVYSYSFGRCKHRAGDVVYRDGGALMLSPRPRAPALVEGTRGPDCDAARSACAIAAAGRRRSALLNMGYLQVECGTRSDADYEAQKSLRRRAFPDQPSLEGDEPFRKVTAAAVLEDATKLVEAMGGALRISKRLVLAASCKPPDIQKEAHGTRAHLDRALKHAARSSAVLDDGSMHRLAVHAWKAMGQRGFRGLPEEVFLKDVCSAAGIGAEAHAIWQEVMNGTLLPFVACFRPKGGGLRREDGDVRVDDIASVDCFQWLWPAYFAFGITEITSDAATCFSQSPFWNWTFEYFVIRQLDEAYCNTNGLWSAALAVLDDLAMPRDGESSDLGKKRVSDAVQSLLTAERIHALAAGDQIDYAEGDPTLPRDPISWARGEIVRFEEKKLVIRVNDEEIETFSGHVRLVEEKPSAAVILLARAVIDHRNGIVAEILESPLLAHPLSYVVGEPPFKPLPGKDPDKPVSVRTALLCTVLDHAIVARNYVAIGLLWAKYIETWNTVLATCHSLKEATRATTSPTERADFACALRTSPGSFLQKHNAWKVFEKISRERLVRDLATSKDVLLTATLLAAADGDVVSVRKFIASRTTVGLRERLISKPLQMISSLWGSAVQETSDSEEVLRIELIALLQFACKMGHEDVVAEVLRCKVTMQICPAAMTAVAEGHMRCLELLLNSSSLDNLLACFKPDASATLKIAGLKLVYQAIKLGDGQAIDLLRSKAVPLVGGELSMTPIEYACYDGQPDAVRALLRDEQVFKSVLEHRSDAIMIAAVHGRASTLEVLFEKFSLTHVKAESSYVDSVLVAAASSNDFATFKIVLDQPGVDIEYAPQGRNPPLQVAASNLNYEMVGALLDLGADTGTSSDVPFQLDALEYSLNSNEAECSLYVARLFLRKRPQTFPPNFLRYVKQHWLHEDLVKDFVDAGADVSRADEYGVTALHVCLYYATIYTAKATETFRLLQMAEALVLHGADVTMKTTAAATESSFPVLGEYSLDSGMTPMDVARNCGAPTRRDIVTKALEAAILKHNTAAGRT